MNKSIVKTAKPIVQAAVIAAILLAGQVALRTLPNVEMVTVVIIVSAYVFSGGVSVLAALVFCTGEWLIYGYGYWVIAYYIYWPSLAAFSLLLKRVKKTVPLAVFATATAVFFSAFFGVLTSAVDAALMSGFSSAFFSLFPVIYARGAAFYITQTVSNAIIVPALFPVLAPALKRAQTPSQKPPIK